MSANSEYDVPQVPYEQLSAFANSLFGYLYFHLNMHTYRVNISEHFKEVIGRAVLRIRKDTCKFNTDILDNCGYGVDRLTLCQQICNLYPDNDYFKKLYYISAFILDVMSWWNTSLDAVDLSMGPTLWITIFRNNFESEFGIYGGWKGLAEAGNACCELLPNEILPGETVLPAYFKAVISVVGRLSPITENPDLDEALEALENLKFGPMEIDDASVDKVAQLAKSEEVEFNQPRRVAQIEGIEENQPEEFADRPNQPFLALGGNVVQSEKPCEDASEKSGKGTLHSVISRNQRKRRHDTPPKCDSDSELDSLSPSKAKVDKK